MRSFFSTPLFRLLTVIINCSMLFPIVGLGFGNEYTSFGSYSSFPNLNSTQMWNFQKTYWKNLGVDLEKYYQQISIPTQKNNEEQAANLSFNDRNGQQTESGKLNPVENEQDKSSVEKEKESITVNQSDYLKQSSEKKKKNNRKSYSTVKNLPDAEKLRTSTAPIPKILDPIPSKACLVSTVNCPSDQNREVPKIADNSGSRIEKLLSGAVSSYLNSSRSGYSFENILALNKNNSTSSNNNENSSEIVTKPLTNSDSSQNNNFFSGLEMYDMSSTSGYSASSSALLLPPGGYGKIFDFDGDGKADFSLWRPNTGEWLILQSSNSSTVVQPNFGLGSAGDRIVPGNYDGDLKTDFAYWTPSTGVWTIKKSSDNQILNYTLGQAGDIPMPGDYDGDGKTDAAVWRPDGGVWIYRKSSDGTIQNYQWGLSTDVPVIGDFDGDGKTDFAVVRPSDTNWYIMQSSNGWMQMQWGTVGDRLVPGNYDGDGKTDLGVWRASDNTWYIRKSTTGAMQTYYWGLASDYPVPADYDGDGKTDFAIWRNSTGDWWVVQSSNGSQYGLNFGSTGDIPVPVSYIAYFSAANQTPTAEAGGPYTAAVNTAIQLNGRNSSDADGQIYGYNWNFGDGTTGTGSKPSHTYTATGTYTVSLTVIDNQGAASAVDTATVNVIDATNARLDPFNAIGGDNVISRNFSWRTGLVGLPGRAGMSASVSLSYNSLVWLKQTIGANNYMIFDPDNGFPGPGFRMGMPVIEKRSYNVQTGKYGYLMVTESGSRVEFRQVGSSNIYETADSNYTQLLDYGNSFLIRSTDGIQYSYQLIGNQFQCIQVKDSNGNYISLAYNNFNRLSQITDTLGRVLVINYDGSGNPLSVVQIYNGQQRTYATFGYDTLTISTNFTNMTVAGPSNGTQITVLKQVAFDDGLYYRFSYNSYGQVYQIDNLAADNHKLNHVKYNLESPGAQTNCPRFTEKEDYAENWMTVTTGFSLPSPATWTMPDTNQSESGLKSEITAPGGVTTYYYYHNSGWDKGIPLLVETLAPVGSQQVLSLQRWETNHLTQDNTSLSYIQNPRVSSSAVGDSGSVRKNSVTYTNFTLPSGTVMYLPNDSLEYSTNGTVYRHAQTDYNFNTEYINRYIVGLINETRLYAGEGTGSLQSKSSFNYDEYTEEPLANLPNIIQHDTANFGTDFQWRGNITSSHRWDVINTTSTSTNKIGYNISGTVAWTQDPIQTTTTRLKVSYADNFSDSVNRYSYAYPTTVTDPDNFTVTTKYNFTSGLVDQLQGPKAGQANNGVRGSIRKTHYDSIDRIEKVETLYSNGTSTGAYTRYAFLPSMTAINTYTRLDNNLVEAFTTAVFDGHSRVRATASELPNSVGGYSGRIFLYDNNGRRWKTSMPTETNASGDPSGWLAKGDDDPNNQPNAGNGWLYNTESFDWKGRSLVLTNTDGTTKETLYEGCGCAGGQTIVTRDEVGRRGKITYDNFGRPSKTQVLLIQPKTETINGDGSPYSTTISVYNVRDQIENTTIYSGSESSTTFQNSTIEYDGFGRTWKTHIPQQQNTNGSPAYTLTNYYPDDTIQSVTDARGVVTNFTYTNRKQTEQVSYSTISGVLGVGSISFQYDSVGNRSLMNDESGSTTYGFDELSRLTSETRNFNVINQIYTRNYSYNAAGLLTGISAAESSSLDVTYNYDSIGRLLQVNGGGYGNLPQNQPVASNLQYRAFGGVKNMSYGNSLNSQRQYNNRLQVSEYKLKNSANQILMGKTYDYGSVNDDLVKKSTDLNNSKLNRTYSYDHLERMTNAKAGNTMTTSGPENGKTDGPFEQSYGTNVFGNFTYMSERIWTSNPWCTNCPGGNTYTETPVNNRNTGTGWNYDADGRLTRSEVNGYVSNYSYDAAGLNRFIHTPSKDIWRDYDGEDREIRLLENNQVKNYYLYSSVLNVKIMDLDSSGYMQRSFIYTPTGERLAKQENNQVLLLHFDIIGESSRETNTSGIVTSKVETDPLGNLTQETATYNYSGSSSYNSNPIGYYGQGSITSIGYCPSSLGMSMPCSVVNALGLQAPSIMQQIANHPWSLSNMWQEEATNRLRNTTDWAEQRNWQAIRDSEQFWQNLTNGFIEIQEYSYIGRELRRTGSYKYNLSNNSSTVTVVSGTKDTQNGLPDCIKNYLVKRWKKNKALVDKVTYTRSDPISLVFTINGFGTSVSFTHEIEAGGFTWGYNIDFFANRFDPNDQNGISLPEVLLAVHEFTHVEQYDRDSLFTIKYLLNYLANRPIAGANALLFGRAVDILKNMNGIHNEAYRNIDFEKEARKFASKVQKDIDENGNPCDPNSYNGKNYGV